MSIENGPLLIFIDHIGAGESVRDIAAEYASKLNREVYVIGHAGFHDVEPPDRIYNFSEISADLVQAGIAFNMPDANIALTSLEKLITPIRNTSEDLAAFNFSLKKALNPPDKIPVPKTYQRNRFKK